MGTQHDHDFADIDCCGDLATFRQTSVVTVPADASESTIPPQLETPALPNVQCPYGSFAVSSVSSVSKISLISNELYTEDTDQEQFKV